MIKTFFSRVIFTARACARAVGRRARALWPRLRKIWDRFGYAASLLLLLALIGAAASLYRSQAARPSAPLPAPTPEPAIPSSAQTQEAPEEAVFLAPVTGEAVGAFRPGEMTWSQTLLLWQTHDGVDVAAPLGTAVSACADGRVIEAGYDALLGYLVRVEHADGYETLYASLQSAKMAESGATVRAGEVIGAVGESADAEEALGAHLHFAMYLNGEAVEPPFAWPPADGE